jgi:uncharacterized cupin superfamily protein
MTMPIQKLPLPETGSPSSAGESYRLPEEKLISGNPLQTSWLGYTDASGRFFAGVWASEVGKWRVSYTEEEVCEMLEGVSILTEEATSVAVTVSAGERFVVPRGFVGTWEVLVPTRKTFVIYEPHEPLAPGAVAD